MTPAEITSLAASLAAIATAVAAILHSLQTRRQLYVRTPPRPPLQRDRSPDARG